MRFLFLICVLYNCALYLCMKPMYDFYPNVTMLYSGICYRKSMSSFICLSSVMFVCLTQGVETYGNISLPFCTLAILWPPCKILCRSSQVNTSIWDVTHKRDIATYVTFGYLCSSWAGLLVIINNTRMHSIDQRMLEKYQRRNYVKSWG